MKYNPKKLAVAATNLALIRKALAYKGLSPCPVAIAIAEAVLQG